MGSLRIRKKGSAGTHNGMKSIIYQIVSEDFPRVRIGIGGERKGDLADYVISGFRKRRPQNRGRQHSQGGRRSDLHSGEKV